MSRLQQTTILFTLTLLVLFTHGFHPLAEDGGLYVAGIKWLLNPALFPHDSAFVTEHLRFSLFAPALAGVVRFTHLSLLSVLFAAYLITTALTLFAAKELLRSCEFGERAQFAGTALLAAWWSIPIAGTSLMLMDPYVTGRSFSTPFGLLAVAYALRRKPNGWLIAMCLLMAGIFHPLMAGYSAAAVLAVFAARSPRPLPSWAALFIGAHLLARELERHAQPEPHAEVLASYSRYYWFLSQWQWYELLGLIGPLVVLYFLTRRDESQVRILRNATLGLSLIATLIALLFAQEHYATHLVARMQPLRVFAFTYAVMLLLLGAKLADWKLTDQRLRNEALDPPLPTHDSTLSVEDSQPRAQRRDLRPKNRGTRILATGLALCFAGSFAIARTTFPASPQVEWPWAETAHTNSWVQAFLWARHNTPNDALFALDAKYVNTDGEDAQTFRAWAERSTLADFSKDGGEASITPALADRWLAESSAQKDLSLKNDVDRDLRLAPYHPTWLILHSDASTSHPCFYRNAVVKVCAVR
ncbi:DUF6798 domain-containing protein [Granulicella cerasi]|uniref:DUF6798 domain-containing protein n=1 Tax=Granulicella cerasi TaxID=741063 RepID=A0ABW1ZFG8_9BACT|nr:DUF6798 domain-containing protein [Granulicella cerasi]